MIYYKNGKFHLPSETITYIHDGEETTKPVGQEGHDWWVEFEKRWTPDFKIVRFTSIRSTAETAAQQERLDRVNELGLKEGYHGDIESYVMDGVFPDGFTHPLMPIQIQTLQARVSMLEDKLVTKAVITEDDQDDLKRAKPTDRKAPTEEEPPIGRE